jgi:hypothetical protein
MKINENKVSNINEYVLTQEELDQVQKNEEDLIKIRAVLACYLQLKSIDGNPVRHHYRHTLMELSK